jgi:hypothetical protein
MSDGGKGDTQRPTDKKAYDEGHDRIFGEKLPWYKRRDNEQQQQQQKDQQS